MVEIDLHKPSIAAFSLVLDGFVTPDGRRKLLNPDRRLVGIPAVADDVPPAWMLEGDRPPPIRPFRRLLLHTLTN